MTWTKLSDDYTDDTWSLSDEAFRLHTEGLVWSNRKLLDMRLPKDDVRRFSKHPEAATELVAGDWWADEGDAYVIRHHARYQRLRDAVIRQQEANRENQAKRGKKTGPAREVHFHDSNNDSLNDSLNESKQENDSFNERDRAGLAGMKKPSDSEVFADEQTGEVFEDRPPAVPAASALSWAVAPIGRSCSVCGKSMGDYPESMKNVCESQDDAHFKARAVPTA